MVAAAENLTLSEFQSRYTNCNRTYEYWYGRAIPKGTPTWIHGYLQALIARLLEDAGYIPGSEVELRIISEAHPKPDVIATRGRMEIPYPTSAVDVVVEILSPEDSMGYVIEKCSSYRDWGFPGIYVVDPKARLVFRWTLHGLEIANMLASIPVEKIWERLDQVLARK